MSTLSKKQTCKYLGCTPHQLGSYVADNLIRGIPVGDETRYDENEVEDLRRYLEGYGVLEEDNEDAECEFQNAEEKKGS
jgi:hypothetical protein